MTEWRKLDHDPLTGLTEEVTFEGEDTIIKTSMDVESIVERNKELQKVNNWDRKKAWHHVGTIDLVTLQRWMEEDGVQFFALSSQEQQAYIRKKLNDPDNRYLKSTAAKL